MKEKNYRIDKDIETEEILKEVEDKKTEISINSEDNDVTKETSETDITYVDSESIELLIIDDSKDYKEKVEIEDCKVIKAATDTVKGNDNIEIKEETEAFDNTEKIIESKEGIKAIEGIKAEEGIKANENMKAKKNVKANENIKAEKNEIGTFITDECTKGNRKVKYKKKPKIIRTILITFISLLLISCITIYLILHSYINKMNLVPTVKREVPFDISSDTDVNEYEDAIEESSSEEDMPPDDETAVSEAVSSDDLSSLEGENSSDNQSAGIQSDNRGHLGETSALEALIKDNIENGPDIMEDSKVQNILLIGSDTRNTEVNGRSDSMILISINERTKTITATSFLRDIYLYIPGKKNNRLNASYAFGGAELLMDTLEQNFKIKIDRYIMVDFFSFIEIVDQIGGISMELKPEELDIMNQYIAEINTLQGEYYSVDYIKKSGIQLLNGKQVLAYSRNRALYNGDFGRTSRQRKVLLAIYDELRKLNLLKLNDALNLILPQITTNFTEGEILTKMLSLLSYMDYDIREMSIPMKGTYTGIRIRNMEVLGIDFKENIKEIQNNLY